MEQEISKLWLRKFKNALLVFLLILVIGVPSFWWFNVSTDARMALREAKNVNLAFQTLAIEHYGQGKSIYNPNRINGLSDGVEERLKEVTENQGDIRLIDYDKYTRTVKKFTYETDNIRVTYMLKDDVINVWKVDYLWNIWIYDGENK